MKKEFWARLLATRLHSWRISEGFFWLYSIYAGKFWTLVNFTRSELKSAESACCSSKHHTPWRSEIFSIQLRKYWPAEWEVSSWKLFIVWKRSTRNIFTVIEKEYRYRSTHSLPRRHMGVCSYPPGKDPGHQLYTRLCGGPKFLWKYNENRKSLATTGVRTPKHPTRRNSHSVPSKPWGQPWLTLILSCYMRLFGFEHELFISWRLGRRSFEISVHIYNLHGSIFQKTNLCKWSN
jgi:hypothetical protein